MRARGGPGKVTVGIEPTHVGFADRSVPISPRHRARPPRITKRRRTSRAAAALGLTALLALAGPGCALSEEPPGGTPGPAAAPLEVRTDVAFVRYPSGRALRLDAYLPARAGGAARPPAVVMVPGGAWRRGGRIDLAPAAQRVAERGHAAFVVDYRRDDTHPFPGAVHDVARALAFVRRNAGRFGIDRSRVALLGTSAGANLAALVAGRPRAARIAGGRPLALVSWSGPMDLMAYADDARALVRCRIGPPWRSRGCTLSQSIVARLPVWLGCPPDARARWLSRDPRPAPCPVLYRQGSPAARIDPRHPPALLVHARADRLVSARQTRLMAARLDRAGVVHRSLILPGRAHGADLLDDALAPTLRFLRAAAERVPPQARRR